MIRTYNLCKEYPNVIALDKVSLDIKTGEFVSIMGPSGSGKSTLMHILGFLDKPSFGTYEFQGKDISGFSDDELAGIRNQEIGFVFQSFNLLSRASILDNVSLPLLYNKNKSNPLEPIKMVGLEHRLEHFPSQLSGGEQQRTAIARSLVNNPSIIFADEPTGNLDSASGEQIMKILSELNKQGRTIVLVTHDNDIAKFSNRIIYLKDGRVVKN